MWNLPIDFYTVTKMCEADFSFSSGRRGGGAMKRQEPTAVLGVTHCHNYARWLSLSIPLLRIDATLADFLGLAPPILCGCLSPGTRQPPGPRCSRIQRCPPAVLALIRARKSGQKNRCPLQALNQFSERGSRCRTKDDFEEGAGLRVWRTNR